MLSDIEITETIEVPYSGTGGAYPLITFSLPTNEPFLLTTIAHTITAGAAILLSNFQVRNELGVSVIFISIIPWQFAGTTINSVTMQTPNPNNTPLFASQILSGFIPKDLHVFNGWTIQYTTFGQDPGEVIAAIITLAKLWQNSDSN